MDQGLTNVPSAEDVDVAFPPKEDDVKYEDTMPDLIAEAEEVYATYDPDSSSTTPDSSSMTPDAKLDENHQVAFASSGAANSSELSIKEGSESSPSLSDSESESSNSSNAYYSLPLNTDRRVLSYENIAEIPRMGDKLEVDHSAEERNPTYNELLRKVDVYEDNLKVSNLRLEKSEEEVSWLKNELQNQLKLAKEEMEALKDELSSERKQVRELVEINMSYQNQLSERDAEVKVLEVSLSSMEETYLVEKSGLLSDISSISAKQSLLETSIAELESLRTSLEGKQTQYEAEIMEMKAQRDAWEVESQIEMSRLKAGLENRGEQVESLNKSFDIFKHRHDMVVAEKDELNAKMDTMRAEMVHQQNQITETERHIQLLTLENGDLNADSERLRKLVEQKRSRVAELEKEVDTQSCEIIAVAEGKREAIRQLCFALEHYRNGYKELRQAIIGHKRLRIPA